MDNGIAPNTAQNMPILQISGLSKKYNSYRTALDTLNMSIYGGRIVGLLGPNGSGKSTLIKIIAGILTPSTGDVRICGHLPGVESKALVSYLPERTYLNSRMKVRDVIRYFEDFYDDFDSEKAYKLLADLGITPSDKLKTMSKGTKEKVQLILVMSRRAKLYLLDEPIGGVDPAARDYILRTIISNYDPGATIIISSHLISDIENVLDDAIFINSGKIVLADSTEKIREEHGESLDELFREMFRV